jgi:hypothetical protein
MANEMLSMALAAIIGKGHQDSSGGGNNMSYDMVFSIHVLVVHGRT